MGHLADIVAAIITAVIGRQIYDSGPKLSAWLVRRAARRLPTAADRERREEEWLAHLEDEPGLAGLYHAAGALVASYRMLLPFETTLIRWCLWLTYRSAEIILHYAVMRPHAARAEASVETASREELETALRIALEIAAQKVIFQIARAQLAHTDVDRAKLRETLQSFRPKPKG